LVQSKNRVNIAVDPANNHLGAANDFEILNIVESGDVMLVLPVLQSMLDSG
jgi:hypothetical protein